MVIPNVWGYIEHGNEGKLDSYEFAIFFCLTRSNLKNWKKKQFY